MNGSIQRACHPSFMKVEGDRITAYMFKSGADQIRAGDIIRFVEGRYTAIFGEVVHVRIDGCAVVYAKVFDNLVDDPGRGFPPHKEIPPWKIQ